jgi:serine/threonine-protein kinase HipA
MIQLSVWLTLNEKTIMHAGDLVVADPDSRGALQGQFRYAREYLDWENAFPLDPVHLPLSAEICDAERPRAGIHGVFEDSLPDDWGRRLLSRKHALPRNEQRPPQLLRCLAGDGMGALSYSEGRKPPDTQELLDVCSLEDLQLLANRFEEDAYAVADEMALLFQAGSSPGGARPKVLVRDAGKSYIAKFQSMRDRFDVVALEAAAMELARRAGVDAAHSRCAPCGKSKILLVERFDRNTNSDTRSHVISMQTLLGADGYYSLGYRDMANIIKKISTDPAGDLKKLFKQLVFHVLIGNTDDHLKNFSMICDGESWRLSPAYDIVPNIGQNREHVLSIQYSTMVPNRAALLGEAKCFGLKQQVKANEIIESVLCEVKRWEEVFQQFKVPRRDIETIGGDITFRIKLCS